jgi:phosphoribosylanthranilate isomerase
VPIENFPHLCTRIKMCGLTRPQDVDDAVAVGADAVGFVLYPPSPRAVTPQRAAELARRLPPFVLPVLLFVNASDALLAEAREALPQALWQFHGDESPERCAAVTGDGAQSFIRAARLPLEQVSGQPVREAGGADLLQFCKDFSSARAILLDAQVDSYGGGGKAFDWSLVPTNVDAHLVLSGGLTPANVGDGVRLLRPRCKSLSVDVSSGIESAKGVKNANKMRAFVAAVRAADADLHAT